jgi:hypothetical protein
LIGGVYMPELSPSDVGLPIDPTTNRIAYDPCYLLDTEKMMWHAGDGWAGKLNNNQP